MQAQTLNLFLGSYYPVLTTIRSLEFYSTIFLNTNSLSVLVIRRGPLVSGPTGAAGLKDEGERTPCQVTEQMDPRVASRQQLHLKPH